ncbi:hypothetical protein AB6A40_008226 [Gnathostoma spinigerum]|uniref:Globin domain-containing protein n=1 Tax=Gnathostoma spinigerum TaxID=75299 RepID=A0ABD6EY35_9BILA
MDCSAIHTKMTLDLIDALIRNLDGSSNKFIEYLQEIGRSHRRLRSEGLNMGVWDDLGDAILESARKFVSLRKHKELRRAWLAVIAFITDIFKQGQSTLRTYRQASFDIGDVQL